MRSAFLSGEVPAVIPSVSMTIPRNVSLVDGPSILEVLTGALMVVQSESIACRLCEHSVEPGKPAVSRCRTWRTPWLCWRDQ